MNIVSKRESESWVGGKERGVRWRDRERERECEREKEREREKRDRREEIRWYC